jgi:GGDEF domain-containing protein
VPFPAATLSISIGLACRVFGPDTAQTGDRALGEALFRQADAALYTAKERGRNQICEA